MGDNPVKEKQSIIPIFLDWTGTINEILSDDKEIGAIKFKRFLESIKQLEATYNTNAIITIISGGSLKDSKIRFDMLRKLSENYGMDNLFQFIVAEYCGYLVSSGGEVTPLERMPIELAEKQSDILSALEVGTINPNVSTFTNILFPDSIAKKDFDKLTSAITELCGTNLDYVSCFDEYGKEFDIKSKNTTKQRAVELMLPIIEERFAQRNILMILTGGDTLKEDIPMSMVNYKNIPIIPLAPNNHDIPRDIVNELNVIVGGDKNVLGIRDSINTVSARVRK